MMTLRAWGMAVAAVLAIAFMSGFAAQMVMAGRAGPAAGT